MPTTKEKVMIYIDKETKNKVAEYAKEETRSISNYIVRLIEQDIKRKETAPAADMGERRL